MGYNITIGEGVILTPNLDDADECGYDLSVGARGECRDDAPSFPGDSMTGKSNGRSPSYSTWSDFCRDAGIYDLFYNKANGLMRKHPGTAFLAPKHGAAIAAALDKYRTKHPGAKPGWREQTEGGNFFDGPWKPETEGLDGTLARLIWLDYWVQWALKNCTVPVIRNT